ncbi:hypothetical protein CSUI_010422 [Cystoisospora suis]|uniref:Transmembrane protein n=1 Tax=Cystoisospora suis TaxID=483139 RepID=A0A2C6KE06_9APIC|nr:hypothetical protein CSUI_010422 [Cystoisospora suis]
MEREIEDVGTSCACVLCSFIAELSVKVLLISLLLFSEPRERLQRKGRETFFFSFILLYFPFLGFLIHTQVSSIHTSCSLRERKNCLGLSFRSCACLFLSICSILVKNDGGLILFSQVYIQRAGRRCRVM